MKEWINREMQTSHFDQVEWILKSKSNKFCHVRSNLIRSSQFLRKQNQVEINQNQFYEKWWLVLTNDK